MDCEKLWFLGFVLFSVEGLKYAKGCSSKNISLKILI